MGGYFLCYSLKAWQPQGGMKKRLHTFLEWVWGTEG